MRRGYLASIAYTDDQVGKVLEGLSAAGMADSTIITFVGDHGWSVTITLQSDA
eukprot:SAG31_NODE_1833_length_7137_cov_2.587667_5_plen_53_part_00